MTVTRRSILTTIAATAAVQAQRNRPPSWKPKLGTLGNYSEANVDFTKAEGFTSMELRFDPMKQDDATLAAIKDKMQRSGLYFSSLACDGNHIDPDPAKRARQIQIARKSIEVCG